MDSKYKRIFKDYTYKLTTKNSLEEYMYFSLLGGHHLRPQLLLAYTHLYKGNLQQAVPAALAVELLHVASLIQDDLPCMDNEKTRHGKECLHLISGEPTAILTSDYCLAKAFELIQSMNITPRKKARITKILSKAFQEMCLGQEMDLSKEKDTGEQFFANRLKTAALLSAACEIGAILGYATSRQISRAASYGLHFGIAYQLKDDCIDKDGMSTILPKEEILRKFRDAKKYLSVRGKGEAAVFLREVTDIALSLQ